MCTAMVVLLVGETFRKRIAKIVETIYAANAVFSGMRLGQT
jgi:hypothetical protein